MTLPIESLIGMQAMKIRREAQAFARTPPSNAFTQARKWYKNAAWELRFFGVIVLGNLAATDERALTFLLERCGRDPAWQVNEALAMAFDDYCAAMGYQNALPTIRKWLAAPSPNLRRAVSEGLRPWTAARRAPFANDPQRAIELLGLLKDDESRYVQESVGNALRDISRKHFNLVLAAVRAWVKEKPESRSRRVIAKFALENAVKTDPSLRLIYEG